MLKENEPIPLGAEPVAYLLNFVAAQLPADPSHEVWLTGSRAKGTHRDDSDWDLVVVSELMSLLHGAAIEIKWCCQAAGLGDRRFDIVVINPADRNSPADFISDWRKWGRRIK